MQAGTGKATRQKEKQRTGDYTALPDLWEGNQKRHTMPGMQPVIQRGHVRAENIGCGSGGTEEKTLA